MISSSTVARLGALAALLTPALALPTAEAPEATITAAPDLDAILEARAALDPTGAWVSVDDEGSPAATYTPFMTTDSEGTSYLRDAAPHDLTATVFTYTNYAKVSTSTGDPPNPTATSKNKEGGFPVCKNMDGDHAPFCNPAVDSMLYQDTIYYGGFFILPKLLLRWWLWLWQHNQEKYIMGLILTLIPKSPGIPNTTTIPTSPSPKMAPSKSPSASTTSTEPERTLRRANSSNSTRQSASPPTGVSIPSRSRENISRASAPTTSPSPS
jgi:hypothetical protein